MDADRWVGVCLLLVQGCSLVDTSDAGREPVVDATPSADVADVSVEAEDASWTDTAVTRSALRGYAQKGPFVPGSQVTVIRLDAELFPTGTTFLTETAGSLGEYELRALRPGNYQIDVAGQTRDPWGDLGGEYTLRAIASAEVVGAPTASVSVVTHLTTPRVRVLVRDAGMTLEEARRQAEMELLTGLDVTIPGFDPGPIGTSVVETGGDAPGPRWVMLVSVIVAALDASYTVDDMADDLRDGSIADAHAIIEAQRGFGWAGVGYDTLVANWSARGLPNPPPDILAILDTDRDAAADRTDNCPYIANADQLDTDADGDGDVCDVTPMGECDPGLTPVAFRDERLYCVERCGIEGDASCGAGSACLRLSFDWTDGPTILDTPICVRDCDPAAADPCPDGFACSPCAAPGACPGGPGGSCIPNPYSYNRDMRCTGLSRDACIDGYGCIRFGFTTAPICRRVCDVDAPTACEGRTCFGYGETSFGFCADP